MYIMCLHAQRCSEMHTSLKVRPQNFLQPPNTAVLWTLGLNVHKYLEKFVFSQVGKEGVAKELWRTRGEKFEHYGVEPDQ